MAAIIENCVSIKTGIREQVNYKRPVLGNGHRLAWFLSCAKKKATNQKEVLAAFRKGIRRWKLFERQTASHHVAKFLKKMEKEYRKRASLSATVGDQTKNPERVHVATASSRSTSNDPGGSSGDPDPDGDDPDSDHHRQAVKPLPKSDPSTPNGGVLYA